jgi:hypothetical protein
VIVTYDGTTPEDPLQPHASLPMQIAKIKLDKLLLPNKTLYGITEDVLPATIIVQWIMRNSSFFTNLNEPTLLTVEDYNVVSLNGTPDTLYSKSFIR